MHSRKDRSNQISEEILNVLALLESTDSGQIESVTALIYEHLSANKDYRLVYSLVDYYISVESHHVLNILLRLSEPHDKHLFNKITELMKIEQYRYKSLQLLINLIYRQPSWRYKMASHDIIKNLLRLLKTDLHAPNLMTGLFIVISLLPMIPSQFGPFLNDTFEIFSQIAAWTVNKPSFIIDNYVFHLQTAIYSLFHRLYGLFPCNFLAYLRSYYGRQENKEENLKVFTSVIKPMLERVRLHPLLVTASKETELSAVRWKRMAYHDIIVECALVSLDVTEGSIESLKRGSTNSQNTSGFESGQFLSFSSQSSCSVNLESEALTSDGPPSNQEPWTPSETFPLSTTVRSSSIPLQGDRMRLSSDDVPLDYAIEAKPETLKTETEVSIEPISISSKDASLSTSCQFATDSLEMDAELKKQGAGNILVATEAKEDDADKEVSELTSALDPSKIPIAEVRHDTPFCSTTQNLTDEPADLTDTMPVPVNVDEDDAEAKDTEEMADSFGSTMENDAEFCASAFTRYRYNSHCLPTTQLSPTRQNLKVSRSLSCPENVYPLDPEVSAAQSNVTEEAKVVEATENSKVVATHTFVPMSIAKRSTEPMKTYEQLMPHIVDPIRQEILVHASSASFGSHSFQATLSPPELLERYILLGSTVGSGQLASVSIPSTQNTDWTHFGGKPPTDEIAILRNQILLLHNQLLFERHRKDIHSDRNRAILGRAKKLKILEDHVIALKEQISLLEQDNDNSKTLIEKKIKVHHQYTAAKQQIENNLLSRIAKLEQENNQLLFSNKNLQSLLVDQKTENDEIREIYKKSQSEITFLKHELERTHKKAVQCSLIEKDCLFLSKQLILLQELITHYKKKVELLKNRPHSNLSIQMMEHSAMIEIEDLKQKLDSRTSQLDFLKTKTADLERLISNMKAKQKDMAQAMESMKLLHTDEISVREERISSLKTVSMHKDQRILSLYADIETLTEEKNRLEKPKFKRAVIYEVPGCSHQEAPNNVTENPPDKQGDASELNQ